VIDGIFVIDATTHSYNLSDDNMCRTEDGPSRYSVVFREVLWGLHARCTPPDSRVSRAQFLTDWSAETLAHTLFTESPVDLAVHHRLRLDSVFRDGLVREEKNAELSERWPQRFRCYAGVNPLDGVEACLRELREQVERVPGTIGLKLYPDAGHPDRSWRLDDPRYAPVFELAMDLGLSSIAVHKVVPNGLTPLEPYRVDDLEAVALRYPRLAFEIVHAGMPPFVEEVTMALMRLPNVYANLEITSAFLERGFGYMSEALAQFIGFAGVHKLLFASGCMHFHPRPVIEAIAALRFDDRTLERYRIEQPTWEDKAAVLGGNYARMAGIDIPAVQQSIEQDEFSASRPSSGEDWRAWRGRFHAQTQEGASAR
jgi:uncharacterized protein